MKNFLVIGNPIKHSLSPLVHNYWISRDKIPAKYEKKQLDEKQLPQIIEEMRENKISGVNITVPFKQKIIPWLDELTEIARATNSVNTLYKKNNKIIGDNTDVFGFKSSLQKQISKIKMKSALLIGAGGVAPSIIFALKELDFEEIYVSNRTNQKFEALKNKFGPILKQILWEDLEYKNIPVDLVINSTSLGLNNQDQVPFNFETIKKNTIFYDVIYNPDQTNFLKKAKSKGNESINGLMMFLYQAQSAYKIWTGIEPQIDEELINLIKNNK